MEVASWILLPSVRRIQLSSAVQAAGISKPGSVSARKATGRAPLTALTKRDGQYQKVSSSPHRLVCCEQGWVNNMPVSDCLCFHPSGSAAVRLQIRLGEDSLAEVKHARRNGKAEPVAEFSGDLLILAVGISRQAGGGHQVRNSNPIGNCLLTRRLQVSSVCRVCPR